MCTSGSLLAFWIGVAYNFFIFKISTKYEKHFEAVYLENYSNELKLEAIKLSHITEEG